MWKKSERHKYFTQQATRLSRKKYSLQSGSMWVLLGHQSEDNQSLLDKRCNQKERHIKSKNSHRISGLSPCGALHCSPLLPSVHLHLNYGQQIHSNLFVNLSCTPQWNLNETVWTTEIQQMYMCKWSEWDFTESSSEVLKCCTRRQPWRGNLLLGMCQEVLPNSAISNMLSRVAQSSFKIFGFFLIPAKILVFCFSKW